MKVQGIVAGVGQVADALTQHQFGGAPQHRLNPVAVGLQQRSGDDERQRDLDNTHDSGIPVRIGGGHIKEHVVWSAGINVKQRSEIMLPHHERNTPHTAEE